MLNRLDAEIASAFSGYIQLQVTVGGRGQWIGSMTTVASFVGETKAAKRYESHLGEAEEAAIRQVRVFLGGMIF